MTWVEDIITGERAGIVVTATTAIIAKKPQEVSTRVAMHAGMRGDMPNDALQLIRVAMVPAIEKKHIAGINGEPPDLYFFSCAMMFLYLPFFICFFCLIYFRTISPSIIVRYLRDAKSNSYFPCSNPTISICQEVSSLTNCINRSIFFSILGKV